MPFQTMKGASSNQDFRGLPSWQYRQLKPPIDCPCCICLLRWHPLGQQVPLGSIPKVMNELASPRKTSLDQY